MADPSGVVRIWAIIYYYYPNFSGAAIQNHRILENLLHQGFSVTILTAGIDSATGLSGREILRDGITVKYLPVIQNRNWNVLDRVPPVQKIARYATALFSKLLFEFLCAWVVLKSGKPGDIIHMISCDEFSFIPAWAGRMRRINTAIQLTLLGWDDPASVISRLKRGRIFELGTWSAFKGARVIISLSRSLTQACFEGGFGPDKVIQIPVGANTELFHPVDSRERANLRLALGLNPDKDYIIFLGTALYRKGIDLLIKAFLQVAGEVDHVDLLIVGQYDFHGSAQFGSTDQDLIDSLMEEIARAGYSPRVHWVGKVDNPEKYLQAANIFCFPTRREGLPNVVAEAMASGLAVVVSRLEGITTDFVTAEDEGVLIASQESSAYADAIVRLLTDPALRLQMRQRARARVEADFALDVVVQQYARLYQQLAHANAPDRRVAQ